MSHAHEHKKRSWLRNAINERVVRTGDQEIIIGDDGAQVPWTFDFRPCFLDARFLECATDLMWAHIAHRGQVAIGGMETAAIPLVTSLVLKSRREGVENSGFYIRKSRKKAGLQKFVEGALADRVVLVDDLLNTGRSIERQIDVIERAGKKVEAIVVIVRFFDPVVYERISAKGVEIISLFTLHDFDRVSIESRRQVPIHNPFEVVWKFRDARPNYYHVVQKSAPVLDGDSVYFGADDHFFYALWQHTGKVKWKFQVKPGDRGKAILSSPALYGDTVYFGAYDGTLYALNTADGSARWRFTEADWIGSSPALAPDLGLVFIGLEYGLWGRRGGICAVRMATGEKEWTYDVPEMVHASPAYLPERGIVLCGCNDGVMRAFRAKDGELLWEYKTGSDIKASVAFDNDRGLAVFGSMDDHLYMLDIETGRLVHKVKFSGGIFSTPKVLGGRAYVGSLDKTVYAVDLGSGSILWRLHTGGRIFSSPEIHEGNVYIGSNDGWLYVIDPETGQPAGLAHGTERIVNKIAVNKLTGNIFIPTHANELYCVKLRHTP